MRPKLVNDFAFKYVFGADTIDSNNALKALLKGGQTSDTKS